MNKLRKKKKYHFVPLDTLDIWADIPPKNVGPTQELSAKLAKPAKPANPAKPTTFINTADEDICLSVMHKLKLKGVL